MSDFSSLELKESLIEATINMGYQEMTEIQEKVIPVALTNNDVIAQAPTGTGKTMAFALPILNKIDVESRKTQAVVIAPTRELACQITKNMKNAGMYLRGLHIVCVYGGESIDIQFRALRKTPHVIVATPGRLIDHLNRGTVSLDDSSIVVLDEADEMLNMGFIDDLDEILSRCNDDHQTMLFSATYPNEIQRIAKRYLKEPTHIKVTKNELTVATVDQRYINCEEKDKVEVISRLIDVCGFKLIMIFCNTKRMVDEVTSSLLIRGFVSEALHGDMKQSQRDRVMERFKSGNVNILVASDVAARGLDVSDVDCVINYDIPTDDEYYVHRIGRTGRANKEGLSITLITEDSKHRLTEIMQYSKALISRMDIPNLDSVVTSRVDRITSRALEKKANPSKYDLVVSEFVNELDEETKCSLLEGLLMMQIGELNDLSEKSRKSNKQKKNARLFIAIGRKDGIKFTQLMDIVCNYGGISHYEIGDVDCRDSFSFVEVPSSCVDQIIYSFATNKIKGKIVGCEVAKERSSKESSHKRSRSQKSSRKEQKSYDYQIKDGYKEVSMKSRSRQSSDSSKKRSSQKSSDRRSQKRH